MSEHTLTDESRELIEDLEHSIGTEGVLWAIDHLHAIERAAAERAREGHIREFLESFELAEILHARNMCTAAHSSRIAGEIRGAWLARHPEAAS